MDDQSLLDVRPILPVAADSLWNQAADRRDQIALDIERSMRELGLYAWVRKSKPGEYPFYVVIEAWRPISSTTITQTIERTSLKIILSVEPFLERPLLYKAELKRHHRYFEATYWQLVTDELNEMVRYLVRGGRKPRFFKSRIDPVTAILTILVPFVHGPRNRLIPEARPNWLTLTSILGSAGILVAGISVLLAYGSSSDFHSDRDPSTYYLLAIAGACALIVAAFIASRRPKHQAIAKQPSRSPRREHIVDSWQICVPNAGGGTFDGFRRRLRDSLHRLGSDVEYNLELHQSLTPTGFEERERLVLTKGQGNLHIHVYPFGQDAFVGWDSYLNWARWSETAPVSSTVRDGTSVEYRSLAVSTHIPSEFDLMELNALAETVHRSIVHEIKAFLKEKEIEADLDFKIIRGDRAMALQAGKGGKTDDVASTFGALVGRRR